MLETSLNPSVYAYFHVMLYFLKLELLGLFESEEDEVYSTG